MVDGECDDIGVQFHLLNYHTHCHHCQSSSLRPLQLSIQVCIAFAAEKKTDVLLQRCVSATNSEDRKVDEFETLWINRHKMFRRHITSIAVSYREQTLTASRSSSSHSKAADSTRRLDEVPIGAAITIISRREECCIRRDAKRLCSVQRTTT